MSLQTHRPPAVAGAFYPGDPTALGALVDDLLATSGPRSAEPVPKAVIAPHAGYRYSGRTAAVAWSRLAPAAATLRRVVLVGPAHREWIPTMAHPDADVLDTPLGPVAVDRRALRELGIPGDPAAHALEHSLEVHLPFLVRACPEASVVPILVGGAAPDDVAAALDRLWGGPETAIVVSSDLSHFLDYDSARRVDADTAHHIVALDAAPIVGEQACGCHGINGLIRVARRRGLRVRELDRCNSGDTAGPRDRVVGYGAFAFYEDDDG